MPTRQGGEGKRGFKWFEIYGGGGSPGGGRKEEEEEIKHPLSSSFHPSDQPTPLWWMRIRPPENYPGLNGPIFQKGNISAEVDFHF